MVLLKGKHWNTIDVHPDLRWFKGIFSKNTFLNNPISFPKNKSLKRLTDFIDETSRKPWTRIVSNGTWERLPICVETLQKTCPAQFRTQHQNRPRCATGMYTLQQTFAVHNFDPKTLHKSRFPLQFDRSSNDPIWPWKMWISFADTQNNPWHSLSLPIKFPYFSPNHLHQWIGWWENLQETMVFTMKYRAFL